MLENYLKRSKFSIKFMLRTYAVSGFEWDLAFTCHHLLNCLMDSLAQGLNSVFFPQSSTVWCDAADMD